MAATSTQATRVLDEAGVRYTLHEYELESGEDAATYGEAVAAALGVEQDRLFKTLLFVVDDLPTVAIVPVDSRVSTKKLARAASGKRAEMVDPATAERLTGYVTGGISPFGQKRQLPIFADEMVSVHDTIYVSGGRRGLQIELEPAPLVAVLSASVSDLTT